MGPLGWPETVFIFFLALILFGPKKLPELGRTVGKALTEFRRASSELKSTFDREMKSLEQETQLKEIANQYQSDTYSYDYSSYESTYEGSYGNENHDSTVTSPSTLSASAPQDAELTSRIAGRHGCSWLGNRRCRRNRRTCSGSTGTWFVGPTPRATGTPPHDAGRT